MNSDREFKTEQEEFWAGEFGSEYIDRNQGNHLLAANLALFSAALRRAQKPDSCIEFGANIGMNLRALKLLYPDQDQYAIEINPDASGALRKLIHPDHVFETSILDFKPSAIIQTWNLVLIKGVLIHINPEFLEQVYAKLYEATDRYLMVCEYYNPTPVSISYRGHADRLFKRDFCGEILDRYPALQLIDYGFVYRHDPSFPQGDCTWFLMERR